MALRKACTGSVRGLDRLPGSSSSSAGEAAACFLVAALSTGWDWYLTAEPAGKVVWCEIEALWGD